MTILVIFRLPSSDSGYNDNSDEDFVPADNGKYEEFDYNDGNNNNDENIRQVGATIATASITCADAHVVVSVSIET